MEAQWEESSKWISFMVWSRIVYIRSHQKASREQIISSSYEIQL